MGVSNGKPLTDYSREARFFLEPLSPLHRQYEALRAYFVEGLPSAEAARRFGYTPGAFRVLCHQFRRTQDLQDVSRRSRSQKGVLVFLARDAEQGVMCYSNAHVSKSEQADEILRFVEFWTQQTGKPPQELVFDSQLTTYANLGQLDRQQIRFLTLRRRTRRLLAEV